MNMNKKTIITILLALVAIMLVTIILTRQENEKIRSGETEVILGIVKDEKSVLPVSVVLNGEYGISNCALSVPAIVCRNGVESLVPVAMSEAEREALNASAKVLKQNMSDIDFSVND